ncbi:MAG: STN domain-containing protein, partial [Rhodocyclaceae bacterium]
MNINAIKAVSMLACLMSLAACSSTPIRSGETYDRISDELRKAGAEPARTARPAAVDRALLAPPVAASLGSAAKEPRFDLVVSNAPAAQVFMAIVSGTRYSMLLPPELAGTITVNLKNVTVRDALDTVRDLYGYEYQVKGTRI